MNGLYFYKLVSPFPEDVTKDCKLTVNEIDHNFITLKKSDISNFYTDSENGFIVLETKGGDVFKADISHFTTDVNVKYDKDNGIIEIHHDGVVDVIDEIVTKDNLSSEIVANIITDDTLVGNGTDKYPIGLSNIEKTSSYKEVIKVVDKTKGCCLPSFERNALGDRYLTYEYYNEYGYLYTYPSALRFVNDLNNEWRIPTKSDWDNTLNAIEFCDEDKNHDATSCNIILGRLAGKLLKSKDKWVNSGCYDNCDCDETDCDYVDDSSDLFCDDDCHHMDDCCHHHTDDCHHHHDCCHPHHKCIKPNGVDSYGMRILPSGYGDGGMMMDYFGRRAKFWTSTEIQVTNMYVKRFDYDKTGVVQVADNPRSLASVRLVKDYDGSNFKSVETIGGVNYKCVLMPANNTTHGFLIWMASNLNANQKKYCPVAPNNGDIQSERKTYFINEWNGFNWLKKELMDGDSLVIKFGPDNDRNAEYRLVDGQLVNIKKDTISDVENKYDDDIDSLKGRLDVVEGEISDIKVSIENINEKLNENDTTNQYLENKIDEEIKSRELVDTQMWDAINGEITSRTEAEKQIWDAVNGEIASRTEAEKQIWDAVNGEITSRTEADTQMWDAINGEITSRTEAEKQIWDAVNGEIASRTEVDTQMWDAIKNINDESDKEYNELKTAIDNEIERSVEQDKRLLSKEGSSFVCSTGILTLKADDDKNDIIIKWDGNYGTF